MKFYTKVEAAKLLGYSYSHVNKLVKEGKLGREIPDRHTYEITQEDIDQYKRPKRGPKSKLLTSKVVQDMRKRMTILEIAQEFKVTPDAVLKRIRKDKLKKQP